jgi:hypothetical protein
VWVWVDCACTAEAQLGKGAGPQSLYLLLHKTKNFSFQCRIFHEGGFGEEVCGIPKPLSWVYSLLPFMIKLGISFPQAL